MRHAVRAVLTAALSLGLVLGLSSLTPAAAAPAAPIALTSTSTSATEAQECLAARNRAAATRQAYTAAVTKQSRIKNRLAKAKKVRAKAKRQATRAIKRHKAGKITLKKRKAAVAKFRKAKRVVTTRNRNLKAQTRIVTVRRVARDNAQKSSLDLCKTQPSTKDEASKAVADRIAAVEKLLTENPLFNMLPEELSGSFEEMLEDLLAQLADLEAQIPGANAGQFDQILNQLLALDPTGLLDQLTSLSDVLGGIAGGAGGIDQLQNVLTALLGQLGAGGLPAGADITVLTGLLDQLVGQLAAADPTGLASVLVAVVDTVNDLLEALLGSAGGANPLESLLGILDGAGLDGLGISQLQSLLGLLTGALAGGAIPGLDSLPGLDGLSPDLLTGVIAGLVGVLGDGLGTDVLTDVINGLLGGLLGGDIGGGPGQGIGLPLDEIPVLGPIVCGLPLLGPLLCG